MDEADLARVDTATLELHAKIVSIITNESSTKVKDYAGRLDREFSPHGPYYFDGLVNLALYLYKLDIPILRTTEVDAIKATEISTQSFKKVISANERRKFIPLFCNLLAAKVLIKN